MLFRREERKENGKRKREGEEWGRAWAESGKREERREEKGWADRRERDKREERKHKSGKIKKDVEPQNRRKWAKSPPRPGAPGRLRPPFYPQDGNYKAESSGEVTGFTSLLHRLRAVQVRQPRGFVIHAHFQRGAWARLRGTQTTVF